MFRLIESSSGAQGTDPCKIVSNALRDPQHLQYVEWNNNNESKHVAHIIVFILEYCILTQFGVFWLTYFTPIYFRFRDMYLKHYKNLE
jgi:hypothetical protein